MTQKEMILKHMQTVGAITPAQAMGEYGCARLAARVADLRADGVKVKTEYISRKNRFGKTVRFAKYAIEQ